MILRFWTAFIGLAFMISSSVFAQDINRQYERDILRLAELLGSMHYLRPLCGAADGQLWREEMEAFIVAEKLNLQFKAHLIERFNRGYQSFAASHKSCTNSARLAMKRYKQKGMRLSQDINTKYAR